MAEVQCYCGTKPRVIANKYSKQKIVDLQSTISSYVYFYYAFIVSV